MIECMSMVHSAILNRTASQYFFAERLQESVMEDPISTHDICVKSELLE